MDDADNIESDTFVCKLWKQVVKKSHLLQQKISEKYTHDKDYVDCAVITATAKV